MITFLSISDMIAFNLVIRSSFPILESCSSSCHFIFFLARKYRLCAFFMTFTQYTQECCIPCP